MAPTKGIFSNIVNNVKGFFNNPSYNEEAATKTDGDLFKAYIPNFLYKPPYGYPRMVDIPRLRDLGKTPYVFMVTTTIIDEVCSVPWDVVPKENDEPDDDNMGEDPKDKSQILTHIKEVKELFNNPNGNEESFEFILRQVLRDILELDSGVIVKVFNKAGKLSQLFGRDGGTFLKNPNIYGYIGDRSEFIPPVDMEGSSTEQVRSYYDNDLRINAAYFQYGWTAGAMPIPFGRSEIVWLSRNPRTDSIYGRSPIEVLNDVILSLVYGANYNYDMYTNNNMPDGIMSLIGANQETIDKFRSRFEKQFKKRDEHGILRKIFHKYPIVNTEAKFTPFQFNSKEMEIIQQQEWFTKLVWSCFGVTPSELGYTESSNLATELNQSRVFKRKAVKPLIKLLQYHINTQILTEFDFDDVEFRFVEYDLDEDIEKHKLYETQIKNGIRSVNEVREEMGLEPVESGDFGNDEQEEGFGEDEGFDEDEDDFWGEDKSVGLKHKYVKRAGSSGNYKYWYKDPKTGKITSSDKETSKKPKKTLDKHLAEYKIHHNNKISSLKSEFKGRKIYGRIKDKESIKGKLIRKPELYKTVNDLKDISGIRIESKSIKNVYKDLEKLKKNHNIAEIKDYIDKPKGDYRSLHVIVKDGNKYTEIQIRTENMTKYADYAHDRIYKIQKGKEKLINKYRSYIDKYSSALSKHFNKLDQGLKSIIPNCTKIIQLTVGCF